MNEENLTIAGVVPSEKEPNLGYKELAEPVMLISQRGYDDEENPAIRRRHIGGLGKEPEFENYDPYCALDELRANASVIAEKLAEEALELRTKN